MGTTHDFVRLPPQVLILNRQGFVPLQLRLVAQHQLLHKHVSLLNLGFQVLRPFSEAVATAEGTHSQTRQRRRGGGREQEQRYKIERKSREQDERARAQSKSTEQEHRTRAQRKSTEQEQGARAETIERATVKSKSTEQNQRARAESKNRDQENSESSANVASSTSSTSSACSACSTGLALAYMCLPPAQTVDCNLSTHQQRHFLARSTLSLAVYLFRSPATQHDWHGMAKAPYYCICDGFL